MKTSLVVSLLLLSFLLHKVQGIRLEKRFMKVDEHKKIHKEKSSLIEKNNGGVGEVILCKEGHCTGITNRKLITVTTSTSTTTTASKNEKNSEGNKANPMSKSRSSTNGEMGAEHEKFTINSSPPISEHQEVNQDHYVEIMDLTEMDYSPARRKPPIHN